MRLGQLSILLAAACVGFSGCSDDEGHCEDFNPTSSPLAVGESTSVDVRIVDGGWETPDVAGFYWSTDEGVPSGAPANGLLTGVATLVRNEEADVAGLLRIDFGEFGVVEFEGPIYCM